MQLQDLKVINRVGAGKADVFLACSKKHGKDLAKEQLFAIQVMEKSKLNHHLRFDLDCNSTLGTAIGHHSLHNYDFMYMNDKFLFLCSEYCHQGSLADIINQKAKSHELISE